jgi:hypothetical protein
MVKVNTKPRPANSVSILCSKSASAMCCCCKVFYMTPHLLSSQFVPKTNRDMLYSCWLVFFFLSSNQCWAVLTFLWEPASSSSYMMLWEPDWFSNNFLWAGENWSGYQYSYFFKLARYLDRAVLTYTIPISFHILFSQPNCWIFH